MFLKTNFGIAIAVNSERYSTVFREFLVQEIRCRRRTRRHVWFQQDVASAHTLNIRPRSELGDRFWEKRYPTEEKQPCSPYLTPGDDVGTNLKSDIYIVTPRTPVDLKDTVKQLICAVSCNVLGTVMGRTLRKIVGERAEK